MTSLQKFHRERMLRHYQSDQQTPVTVTAGAEQLILPHHQTDILYLEQTLDITTDESVMLAEKLIPVAIAIKLIVLGKTINRDIYEYLMGKNAEIANKTAEQELMSVDWEYDINQTYTIEV